MRTKYRASERRRNTVFASLAAIVAISGGAALASAHQLTASPAASASSGPCTVPNFIGLQLRDADALAATTTCNYIRASRTVRPPTIRFLKVFFQDYAPGTVLPAGTTVTYYYGRIPG
jgi:hypothetical protein